MSCYQTLHKREANNSSHGLRKKRRNKEIVLNEGLSVPFSVSLGAAGSDRFPVDQIMKQAEEAIYADKEEHYRTYKKYR